MKKQLSAILLFNLFFLFTACSSTKSSFQEDDGQLTISIVQINDVYEIAPISNGREGGVARVASLIQQTKKHNPNTISMIAGDFLSPSVFNNLKHNGERIRGKQMIDALNSAGLNFAGFGNHEFDIKEHELLARLNESNFQWVASNAFHSDDGNPNLFEQNGTEIPQSVILTFKDADGTEAKVGIFSVVLPFNQSNYVSYSDPFESAELQYNYLAKHTDAVIALTHLNIEEDIELAKRLPNLAAIIGGHEHDMRYETVGNVSITKAHSNARSAYVIHLTIQPEDDSTKSVEELVYLNDDIPLDVSTTQTVDKWMTIAADSYASSGFDANRVILDAEIEPFDILETSIRTKPTNFSKLVVKSMEQSDENIDIAIVNSGSIRLDDMLYAPITEFDILRTMPYGGEIIKADITGDMLVEILNASRVNYGKGGFLQVSESITELGSNWLYNGHPIQPTETFTIAISDFLFAGLEANMAFINSSHPGVIKMYEQPTDELHPRNDIRRAVIKYITEQY